MAEPLLSTGRRVLDRAELPVRAWRAGHDPELAAWVGDVVDEWWIAQIDLGTRLGVLEWLMGFYRGPGFAVGSHP